MKFFAKFLIIVCVFAVGLFVLPFASADAWNRKTTVTFSQPVEVPGTDPQVLPAGTYVFMILDSSSERHIVRITSPDEKHVYTTILAIPNYRFKTTGKTVITFKERAEGEPEAIRAWFYPGREWGEEFVYSKEKAVVLAQVTNEPVLYVPAEVTTVEAFKTAPLAAVKPTGEDVPVAEVVQPPPPEQVAAVAAAPAEQPATLPQTGSNLPLLLCFGLLSLGAAGVMSKRTV
jgi:LPXTG-motif cell wall-anchored protein